MTSLTVVKLTDEEADRGGEERSSREKGIEEGLRE